MGSPGKNIVVVGGGPAGVFAAIEAKRADPAARVTLLSDEGCEPYEKPPLSKAVLTGKALPEHAPTAGRNGIAAHDIVLECGACADAIDRAAHEVVTDSGKRFAYDALILAPGSLNRELPQWPAGMARVHYLRNEAEARALKAALAPGKALLIVGGGLIGLEVAASAVSLGIKTTVLEVASRILARVCDEETGAVIAATHQRHGVDLHVSEMIEHVTPRETGIDVETKSGKKLFAEVVVVGAGVKPNVALAAAAGLAVNDGIVVDEHCRTSDPAILACGDAVRFPGPAGPIRLENWRHAIDHGMVAGRNAAGKADVYKSLPSFWSEQYDLYIQGVGWPAAAPRQRVHRTLEGGRPMTFELADGAVAYAMGINVQREIAVARRLIERKVPVDAAALADAAVPLAKLLG